AGCGSRCARTRVHIPASRVPGAGMGLTVSSSRSSSACPRSPTRTCAGRSCGTGAITGVPGSKRNRSEVCQDGNLTNGATALSAGCMDQLDVVHHLELAQHHVAQGERLIARQRQIVAELGRSGHEIVQAETLLALLQQTQALAFEEIERCEEL